MTKQPVYLKFNSYRKPEFALSTKIYHTNKKFSVVKSAPRKESIDFLNKILESHKVLSQSALPLKIHDVKKLTKKEIEIEYIDGKTLLNKLEDFAKNNSKQACVQIFRDFAKLLDKFPTEKGPLSENFVTIFGDHNEKEKYQLITPGILDLNLDNIIEGNRNNLTLIDFEWTFDFGIPKRYILYRTIYSSYLSLKNSLGKVIQIEEIEKIFGFSEEEINLYLKWEANFQHYVTGRKSEKIKTYDTRKEIYTRDFFFKNFHKEKEFLHYENRILSKNLRKIEEVYGEAASSAQEFESFKKGAIWRSLSIYRKFKHKMKNFLSKTFEIVKRIFSYLIALPKLLTEFPLKEFPMRVYIALRFVKYTEYNRDYQIYLRQNKLDKKEYKEAIKDISSFKKQPLISIIMPVYNVDLKWIKKAIQSIQAQWYTNWELCIADDASINTQLKKYLEKINEDPRIKVVFREKNGHISEASNSALDVAEGEFIVLMDNDDEIHPQALYKIAKVVNENPNVRLIYSDEDKMELNGTRCDPIFKSDYSPDYLLSTNYFCHLTSIRKDLVDKVGGFRKGYEGSQDYDLFLRVVEQIEEEDIFHIPDVLYSWRKIPGSTALTYDQKGYAQAASLKALQDTVERRNIDGEVVEGLQGGFFRIKYKIKNKPLISIIITITDINSHLEELIETILNKTDYQNYEIVIISTSKEENESTERENIHFYHFEKEYNIPEMRNLGVEKARGEYIVILDENTEIIDSGWLEGLLEYAQRENTGAVGPRILSKNDEVLFTSFWFDENNTIRNTHRTLPPHMQVRANLVANYTIISDICFMISKKKYEEIRGFEEEKDSVDSWLDFFLKLNERNLYNVYTPFTKVICPRERHMNKRNRLKKSKELENVQRRFITLKKALY
jgi:glycosyltransferase involved in cell wall biosynthesis